MTAKNDPVVAVKRLHLANEYRRLRKHDRALARVAFIRNRAQRRKLMNLELESDGRHR